MFYSIGFYAFISVFFDPVYDRDVTEKQESKCMSRQNDGFPQVPIWFTLSNLPRQWL